MEFLKSQTTKYGLRFTSSAISQSLEKNVRRIRRRNQPRRCRNSVAIRGHNSAVRFTPRCNLLEKASEAEKEMGGNAVDSFFFQPTSSVDDRLSVFGLDPLFSFCVNLNNAELLFSENCKVYRRNYSENLNSFRNVHSMGLAGSSALPLQLGSSKFWKKIIIKRKSD